MYSVSKRSSISVQKIYIFAKVNQVTKFGGVVHILHLDHLVVPVSDIEASAEFYTKYLNMRVERTESGRVSLHFGNQKINLHPAGWDFWLKAKTHLAGTADLCFVVQESVREIEKELQSAGIEICEGPVAREGAVGEMLSVYFWDPDGNLIELSNYIR
jgi:catechol 2,3-dioxygenase-like lactoylglutathione lyase family enzyme|tara:strand:- start:779 stop:1252 length:474 start_codon:yes stop_codon:yes gene_type:complete